MNPVSLALPQTSLLSSATVSNLDSANHSTSRGWMSSPLRSTSSSMRWLCMGDRRALAISCRIRTRHRGHQEPTGERLTFNYDGSFRLASGGVQSMTDLCLTLSPCLYWFDIPISVLLCLHLHCRTLRGTRWEGLKKSFRELVASTKTVGPRR